MISSVVSGIAGRKLNFGRIILASGDDVYLSRFAEALCNSIVRKSQSFCTIHLHAINPSPHTLELLDRLTQRQDVPIVYSTETADVSALTDKQRKVYYACARFLRLPALLAQYNAPILMLDLDQTIVAPLTAAFGDADISMICYRQGSWNILSMFSASIVRVLNSTVGKTFAMGVRDYITARVEEGAMHWHLDQAALAVTYLKTADKSGFHMYNPSIMHSGADVAKLPPETIFWSITYSIPSFATKLESDRFKAFAP